MTEYIYVASWKHDIISAARSSIEEFENDNLGSEFSWIFKGLTVTENHITPLLQDFTSLILLVIYIDALL